jgi:protein tyrosine/serine phosphatase
MKKNARPTIVNLVLVFFVGGGLVGCAGVPANDTSDPTANFHEVSQGLYRGARPDEAGIEALKNMGVKTIVNLENDAQAIADEKQWLDARGMMQVVEEMTGTTAPEDTQVSQTLGILADPDKRPMFVHCMKGQDRTGVIIALHRIFNEGWSAKAAEDEMLGFGFNTMLGALKNYFELKAGI